MAAIFNPSTGISTVDAPDTKLPDKPKEDNSEMISKQIARANSAPQVIKIYQSPKQKRSFLAERQAANRKNPIRGTIFGRTLGIGQPRKALTIKDKIKIIRFKNRLEKEKLKNALEKFKIARQIDLARKKGILQPAQQVMAQPMPRLQYPAYSTPMEQADIDGSFNADIGSAKNDLWGAEQYHGEEFFDHNDFFLENEFNQDPLLQLAIKARQGVSPLWW